MPSPYEGLPSGRFWKTGVSGQDPHNVADLYTKRFDIRRHDRIATAGSCFAQHIGRHLRKRGFAVMDSEPAAPKLPDAIAQKFGYGLYSARYGNIYTARQLLQLACEAYGTFAPANPVWKRGQRYFDALRPSVEPEGLAGADHVLRHRERHLQKVRRVFDSADVFVFTFGLTESWVDRQTGTVYPTAPGTIAGAFDPDIHAFRNFTYEEVLADFIAFRALLKTRNPSLKFLLTVSPVPLVATASGEHVLVATTYSKSVLRAVAGRLVQMFDDVDYFPSYELIASAFSRGAFYENNLRSVSDEGVELVMRMFFDTHGGHRAGRALSQPAAAPAAVPDGGENVVCEDVLLEAFAK
jgi:hypothetical protein